MKTLKKIGIVLVLIIVVFSIIFMIPVGEPETPYMTEELAKIEQYLENRDAKNNEVSQVDVAWHLDHVLKTIVSIHSDMEGSDPAEYDGGKFSIPLEMIFLMGDFPRGVAQAPDNVRPPENIRTADILLQLEEARDRLNRVGKLEPNQYFENAAFGQMSRNEAVRFIKIHTNHHYKIIEDILAE